MVSYGTKKMISSSFPREFCTYLTQDTDERMGKTTDNRYEFFRLTKILQTKYDNTR